MRTYPSSFHLVKDVLGYAQDRTIMAIREGLRNLHRYSKENGYRAKAIIFATYYPKDGMYYLAMGHNGDPMKGIDDLISNACTPCESTLGEGAVRGCGLTISGFSCAPVNQEHVIIASKCGDDICVGKGWPDDPRWKTADISKEWGPMIRKIIGKRFDKFNVYYFFPYIASPNAALSVSILNSLSFICGGLLEKEFVEIDVQCFFNTIVNKSQIGGKTLETLDQVDSSVSGGEITNLSSKSDFIARYADKTFSWNKDDLLLEFSQDGTVNKISCSATMSVHCFPGFEDSKRRLRNLRDIGKAQRGKAWIGFGTPPRHNLFLRIPGVLELEDEARQIQYKRLRHDAVYFTSHINDFMSALRLTYVQPKFAEIRDAAKDLENWPEYSDLFGDETKRRPFVIVECELVKFHTWVATKDGETTDLMRQARLGPMCRTLGGLLLENFYLSDSTKCRDIIRAICSAISEQITKEQFEYFDKKLFLVEKSARVGIYEVREEKQKKCKLINEDEQPIKEISLDKRRLIVDVVDSNGRKLRREDFSIAPDCRGFNFENVE